MEWFEKYIDPGEEVIFRTRPHYSLLLLPCALLLFCFLSLWFLLLTIPSIAYGIGQYLYYDYVITNHRVIIKKGLFYVRTVDIWLDEIDDVLMRKSGWDNITGSGSIFIFSTGTAIQKLHRLAKAATFRDALYSQLPASSISYYEERWKNF